jgi:hypothetical protein
MINNEHFWVGEVVEFQSNDILILELFNKDYNLVRNPIVSYQQNDDEVLFCALRSFQDSLDHTRKAVALNMSENELQQEHPEHRLLIKPYLSILLLGSIHGKTFSRGIQKVNIGLHNRLHITPETSVQWFLTNKTALSSLLWQIVNSLFLKPQLKSICSLLARGSDFIEYKSVFLQILSSLLRDDYFTLKEIADDLNQC